MSKKKSEPKLKSNNLTQDAGKSFDFKSYPNGWHILTWLIYLCYCYAAFFPTGPVWGIHFIAYIPETEKILLLLAGGFLLVPGIQRRLYVAIENLFGSKAPEKKGRIIPAAIIAVICFMLFHTFTMKTDIYGDDRLMLKVYGDNSKFDWSWFTDMFSSNLDVNKEALTVAIHRTVAYLFSIPIELSYEIMSEIFGAIFVFIWLMFVQKVSSGLLRIVLIILGLFAGSIQVFFGHVENYSFSIVTYMLFFTGLYFYLEDKIGTLAFVLLYLFAFKAHIVAILFFPAVLIALAYHYRNTFPKLRSLLTWGRVRRVIILPAFALGVVLYIFLFHSWNEPYGYSTGRQFQQSFLQVVMLPPPLDHYSLWSPYHIADFFNVLLMTSAPIVMLLANLMIFNRKKIDWQQPKVIAFGLAALFPFLFFMAMNPLLTPVRDWDVSTLLFPPLLFFASILLIQPGVRPYLPAWFGQSLVFGVLITTVLVAVNASPLELENRLQDAGAYTYQSYYAGSDYIEGRSLALDDTLNASPVHFSHVIEELASGSTTGKDQELANMMSRLASLYEHAGNDSSAIIWAAEARKTDTRIHKYILDLAAYCAQANRLADASRVINGYLKNKMSRNDTDSRNDIELASVMATLAAHYSRIGDDSSTVFWAAEARKTQPHNLNYIYDQADYYMQTNRLPQALEGFRAIPPDSLSVDALTSMSIAEANLYGPDSGLPYLYKAKALAPSDRSVDSLISEMKK